MDSVVHIPNCPFHPAIFAERIVQVFEYKCLNLYSFKFVLSFFLAWCAFKLRVGAAQQTHFCSATLEKMDGLNMGK